MTDPSHIDDEQRRVTELLHSFNEVPAPESLHRRIDSMVASRQKRRVARWSPLALASSAAGAVTVAAVVLVFALSGGSGSGVSFDQAAAPTLRAATLPAPAQSQTNHAELDVSVDDIAFPDLAGAGWHSSGSRADRVAGRSIKTVFYTDAVGRRIGYSILAGTPAPSASGGTVNSYGYRLLTENGAATVTWLRDGHLCVMSGHGVSGKTLLGLASESRTSVA